MFMNLTLLFIFCCIFILVTCHVNDETLSDNPEPAMSQRKHNPSEHQTREPGQQLSQETPPQTKSEGLGKIHFNK